MRLLAILILLAFPATAEAHKGHHRHKRHHHAKKVHPRPQRTPTVAVVTSSPPLEAIEVPATEEETLLEPTQELREALEEEGWTPEEVEIMESEDGPETASASTFYSSG